MKNFKKIAIPNRGEIAVRIIKTLKEMNIASVLCHSSGDQNSMAYRYADEALCIGPSDIKESYLNLSNIISAVQSSGADAVHPGAGFLSESASLAQALSKNGISFIGPSFEHLKLFENKIDALSHIQSLGIPVLPSVSETQDLNALTQKAQKLGYPLMVKLAKGGAGVGLKKVNKPEDLLSAIQSVQRIGKSIFNSTRFFLEKYLPSARHIEVQIFGDSTGKIHHFFERDCSIQRRNQKVIEESPSCLPRPLVDSLIQSALDIARSVQYQSAGTVEFLVQGENFYFIEMNARLQIEHPITEVTSGVDLVRSQILTALNKPAFTPFQSRGHAIECRIYLQDPATQIPKSGKLGAVYWMQAPHSRLDMGYESYDRVPCEYDPMLGKVIAWAETRTRAIEKMLGILKNSFVFGLPTNIPELIALLSSPEYHDQQFNLSDPPQSFPDKPLSDTNDIQAGLAADFKENTTNLFNPWTHTWPRSPLITKEK